MKNKQNTMQNNINKIMYEKYINKKLLLLEEEKTQILENNIKSCDFGFITLALINKYKIQEMVWEPGFWLIKKDKGLENLYRKYINKEALVEGLVYSRTLINLIIKDIKKHAELK